MRKAFITVLAIAVIAAMSVPAWSQDVVNNGNVGPQVNSNTDTNVGPVTAGALIDQSGSTYEASERPFPSGQGTNFGPVLNYYGKPLPSAAFRPVENLLKYGNVFSEGALREIIKGGKFIHELEIVRGPEQQVRAKYEKGEIRWIKIIASNAVLEDHGLIGQGTCEANNRKTDMLEVMARAALDALCEGADVLQIVAQGASRDTESSGWGIGFNTTQATIFDGTGAAASSNLTSGGTGYSQAWAGSRDKPWIQTNALKAPTKIVGKLLPKPEKKAEVKKVEPKKKAEVKKDDVKKVSKVEKKKPYVASWEKQGSDR